MKKTTFLLGLTLMSYFGFAQEGHVGINTDTPTNTLHVKVVTPNAENKKQDPVRFEGLVEDYGSRC